MAWDRSRPSITLPQERLEKGKRETVLDRVVRIEKEPILDIPDIPRWYDRLDLTKSRVNIGECELYVEKAGEGMVMVLLHGGPGGTHHSFHPEFSRAIGSASTIINQRGKKSLELLCTSGSTTPVLTVS